MTITQAPSDLKTVKGRFAPSPTGRMHAGNIFSALCAWLVAKVQNGTITLRIEDLDKQRSKREFISLVQADFEALGLHWDEGPYFQHDRDEIYQHAFDLLEAQGLVYPCFCTRADLHAASAPHAGEKFVYPRTCASLGKDEVRQRALLRNPSYRVRVSDETYSFDDLFQGEYSQQLSSECGDFLIRRSDGDFAYQLAVIIDDAEQGITSVVRGVDLIDSVPQQCYLQNLLGLPHPEYGHVPLLVAEDGRRLSKRNRDASMEELLDRFEDERGIIGYLAFRAGFIEAFEPISPEELLAELSLDDIVHALRKRTEIPWK